MCYELVYLLKHPILKFQYRMFSPPVKIILRKVLVGFLNNSYFCCEQVSVVDELSIPVKFVGIGEGLNDLQPFHAATFVNDLLP